MPIGSLTVRFDSAFFARQVRDLAGLLDGLPEDRARHIQRKALRLVRDGLRVEQRASHKHRATPGAGDIRLQIRVVGLDELIAAALRAGQRKRAGLDSHGGTCGE
jgi:hypothetical protein